MLRLLASVAGWRLAQWWNPVTWAADIGSLFGTTVTEIEGWVKATIALAIALFDQALKVTIDAIQEALTFAGAIIGYLGRTLTQLAATFWSYVDKTVPYLLTWVLTKAIEWATEGLHLVETLITKIASAIWAAVHLVTDAITWWVHEVITPLWDFFEGIATWLGQQLASWWSDIYGLFIAPVVALVEWLWANVPQWVAWLGSVAYGAIATVLKAATWLIWFGEHTFDDLVTIINATINDVTAGALFSAASGTPGDLVTLEDKLVELLGA